MLDKDQREKLIEEISDRLIPVLSQKAADIPIEESAIVALDWMNGRRTPDANQMLKGAIMNMDLASDAPKIFKALVEATAFGSKKIVERFLTQGIEIKKVAALGGVAKKSSFVMQVMTDVLNMPIKVVKSDQSVALGAAIFAATVAGIYPGVKESQKMMGKGYEREYLPDPENARMYEKLYQQYSRFGEFVEKETKGE